MHILICVLFAAACWKWGDWRNWRTYHSTMLYIVMSNLLYLFLTAENYLWRYEPEDYFYNYAITEALYGFIVLPATVLLFLPHLPSKPKKLAGYYMLWIGVYFTMEAVLLTSKRLLHDNGWNLYWSLIFDLIMFPMLVLHHKKPLLCYFLSAIIAALLLWKFDIPIHLPIEKRD
ncbi:CBO0543 family protein [Paenibacillus silvisoli]|uniref:CBO0543 family protein n=1 Tax=Paenibacillus silvisoli TaxID=3110539 RepID=UPI0028057AF2|nr:CBO0543 family protein [Paenibacillus silvisoli]